MAYRFPPPSFTLERALIQQAAAAIAPYNLVRTRVILSPALSERLKRDVFLKCENEQLTGSFKLRGALFPSFAAFV
jgi:threonine dehydratase